MSEPSDGATRTATSDAPATKYDDLSREMLLAILKRQEFQRKFGLVWERPPAELEVAINEDFVALEVVPELSHGTPTFENLIIEGDNFDAIRALRATHAGKVKVINIDPPYNTGKRDFVYNDRYVDSEHRFRHSLWVEFMYQRLTIARELLRDDGVIFVNIGEEEFAHLSMLMDQVFPGMKVGSFVWRTREGGNDAQKDGPFFSQDHEYVLCYAGPQFRFGGQAKNQSHYDNPDNDPRGPWFGSDLTTPKTISQVPKSYYPVLNPATGIWYPGNPDRVWGNASEKNVKKGQKLKAMTMEALVADGRIIFPEKETPVTYATRAELDDAIVAETAPRVLRLGLPGLDDLVGKPLGFGRPKLKRFQKEGRTQTKPLSSWVLASSASDAERAVVPNDANVIVAATSREATQTVNRILGKKLFSYPKPVSLYRALLEQSTDAEGADIVLDFFAGSGTTAHAVMELNAQDGGNRRFVLVSSTESTDEESDKNICRDVCRERVARVMGGLPGEGQGAREEQDRRWDGGCIRVPEGSPPADGDRLGQTPAPMGVDRYSAPSCREHSVLDAAEGGQGAVIARH